MRVMIDTNIFISAVLFPKGSAAAALLKALMPPFIPMTSDYVIDELHRKFQEKFPHKTIGLEAFLYSSLSVIRVVNTPNTSCEVENKIRDPKDRPILMAALASSADLFLTGDKDFLEAAVNDPRIISVAQFLAL